MSLNNISYTPIKNKEVTIELPASKSIANRLLILQKIAKSTFKIDNLSSANDTVLLSKILESEVIPPMINCEDAGTVLRFMTCICAAQPNKIYRLTGRQRLLSRPMRPLIDSLIDLGAEIKIVDDYILIHGNSLQNKSIEIAGDVSSQFISGLCLISPLIKNGLSLKITGPILSKPYIDLTLQLLSSFGIKSIFESDLISIPQQEITPTDIKVENDWSSATFFYAFLILNKDVRSILLSGLQSNDMQGDKYIVSLASDLGILTEFSNTGALISRISKGNAPKEIDLGNYPDLAIPIIVACAFQFPDILFTGLSHLRAKESDRIHALQHNLEKFGIYVNEENGAISIKNSSQIPISKEVKIKTFNDHRIAMSFSILAVLGYKIMLDDVNCIDKSFPDFLQQISKLGLSSKN